MEDSFDPLQKVELAMIRAEHQKRFQVMINFVKDRVGKPKGRNDVGNPSYYRHGSADGRGAPRHSVVEYQNSVVRFVVSNAGAYAELLDLPEEFSGAVIEDGDVDQQYLSREEAIAALSRGADATKLVTPENTRQLSILALYSRKGLVDRRNCFVYESRFTQGRSVRPPLIIGKLQPDRMPLFFKIKMSSDLAPATVGMTAGIVLCMATSGDRNLMVRLPYDEANTVDVLDDHDVDTIQ